MPSLTIEQLSADHLPHVMALQKESFGDHFQEPLSLFEEMLTQSPQTHFIALHEGQAVGYCFAHPCMQGRRDFETGCGALSGLEDAYYIHDLCVSPNSRGLGIAAKLFNAQQEKARAFGFSQILGVSVQNSATFWEKLGFSMAEPYVYMGEEGIFMSKDIE